MNIKSYLKGLLDSENPIVKCVSKTMYYVLIDNNIAYKLRYKFYMGDLKYLKLTYKKKFGKELNLENPKSFNEKNNWRKLYDRCPEYSVMADKYKMKAYVEEKCGKGHTIPLLDVWSKTEDICIDNLPDQFVLKPNHAGGVIVCKNKASFDIVKAKKELRNSLKKDYSLSSREWPYKDIERKVICEEYIDDNLIEYKNYCFNGKMLYTFVWENESRKDGRKPKPYFCGAYDRTWQNIGIEIKYPSIDKDMSCPECYEEMIDIAEKLSKEIPFVRVDCYVINGRVYVGEMTFFPWGGFMQFKDENWDFKLGELEDISGMIYNINK